MDIATLEMRSAGDAGLIERAHQYVPVVLTIGKVKGDAPTRRQVAPLTLTSAWSSCLTWGGYVIVDTKLKSMV